METGLSAKAWLETRQPRLVELLEQLVTIESHAAQPDGVAEAAALLITELAPLGFSFTEVPQQPIPDSLRWLEELMSPGTPYTGLGSTYPGFRVGERPGRLLLVGDLDTAFPRGSLAGFGFRIEGGRAYGPGIADMKGGLVVMVAALQALHHLGVGTPDIALVLSGDEQAGSLGSRQVVEQAGIGADWCLGMECARRGGKLMGGRGHIGVGRITVRGKESHTGSAHAQGVNALEALARLIIGSNSLTDEEEGTFITVTMAHAGRRRSVTPAHASAVVDIRTRAPQYWEAATRRMQALARSVEDDSGAQIELLTHNHRPGLRWNKGTDRLLSVSEQVGKELSIEIDAFESAAAGSVSFRSPSTVTLDGLGPVGGGLMTRSEHIELDSLVSRAALLAGIISELAPTAR